MLPKQLRNGILHLAITGKLVEQDPNDEPASVLLEKIRAEKQELIKSGKIKKDKNESFIYRNPYGVPYEKIGDKEQCIAEQIPFEIPNSWEWVRLGSVFQHNTGKALNSSNRTGKLLKYITTSNLYWNYFQLDSLKEMYFTESEVEKCTVKKGDLLVCEGGDVGRTAIWPFDYNICIQNHLHRLRPYIPVIIEYFYYILYFYKNTGLIQGRGIAIKGLSSNMLHNLLIPLPPLEEQKRIVEKLEKLLPLVDEYEENYNELEKLDSEFPDKFKKSILQYAIQGKLVKQDPNDEPASVLLEKIRAEKQELIKSGKIKKDKNEAVIYRKTSANVSYEKVQNEGSVDFYEKFANGEEKCINDELPFEIPSSWEWVRLGNVSTYSQPKKKIKLNSVDQKIWGLELEDIAKGGKILSKKSVEDRNSTGDKTIFDKGDILYSKLRPYLLKILVSDEAGICTSEIVPFKCYGNIISEYIVFYLKSPYVDYSINRLTYGTKMPRVGTETMTNLLIPLPPLEEQKRIVAKIEELFKIIEPLIEK